jgi:hypothetical protein
MITIDVRRGAPPAIGRCRSCQRLIEWVQTPRGARMPIDVPLIIEREFERHDGVTMTTVDTARSHFATCPQAKAWRNTVR